MIGKCLNLHRKGLFLGSVVSLKIVGGPPVSVGMWPLGAEP